MKILRWISINSIFWHGKYILYQNKPTIFINGKWHVWILYFVFTNFFELLWPVLVMGVQGHQGVIQSVLLHVHLIVRLIESWCKAVNIFNVDEDYSSGKKWKKLIIWSTSTIIYTRNGDWIPHPKKRFKINPMLNAKFI